LLIAILLERKTYGRKLTTTSRRRLAQIIVRSLLEKDPNTNLSSHHLVKLSNEIGSMFTKNHHTIQLIYLQEPERRKEILQGSSMRLT